MNVAAVILTENTANLDLVIAIHYVLAIKVFVVAFLRIAFICLHLLSKKHPFHAIVTETLKITINNENK